LRGVRLQSRTIPYELKGHTIFNVAKKELAIAAGIFNVVQIDSFYGIIF